MVVVKKRPDNPGLDTATPSPVSHWELGNRLTPSGEGAVLHGRWMHEFIHPDPLLNLRTYLHAEFDDQLGAIRDSRSVRQQPGVGAT